MFHRHEDATVWIGYSDFLTTLVILFFVIAVTLAAQVPTMQTSVVTGVVQDSIDGTAVPQCAIWVGERNEPANRQGRFVLVIDSVPNRLRLSASAECPGYEMQSRAVTVTAGDTIDLTFRLRPAQPTWQPVILPGDALFDVLSHSLSPSGKQLVIQEGLKLKSILRPGEAIVVQGHTDDVPIAKHLGKDNWVLSGERAAAAAAVLLANIGISECQIVIMGFGPARPRPGHRVTWSSTETAADRDRKRRQNRRIELHHVAGTDLIGGGCV
jgi:outer membrane protein OmpA-like peptidoglycan-associated protein